MAPLPTIEALDRRIAEGSLPDFIRQGWHTVESSTYRHNWHIDAVADHLEAAARREIRRLIINVPPRHMKSLECGVFFPAWVWAQNPDPLNRNPQATIRQNTWLGPGTKFLTLAHKVEMSERDAKQSRRVIESQWYQRRWGSRVKFSTDENASGRYRNSAMGARYTGSTGGGLLGEGGDIIIVDDPHPTMGMTDKQRLGVIDWWNETLKTRLNDFRTGVFIVIMQRLHERDLTGHILATETGWDHLCLPAEYEANHPTPVRSSIGFTDPRKEGDLLWPERFDRKAIADLHMSEYARAGQLQQRPSPREGGLFKKWWFVVRTAAPNTGRVGRRWDIAATQKQAGNDPDWTVGVRMRKCAEGFYWIEDVVRLRGSPHEVEAAILATARQDGSSVTQWVVQDPGAAGKMVAQHLVRRIAPMPARIAHEGQMGSKIERADPFAAQAEAGNVYLIRGAWNDPFLEELALFPNASHDDQVDAAAGAFLALNAQQVAAIAEMKA